MIVINARNVQDALYQGLVMTVGDQVSKVKTRNGLALEFNCPVTTVYRNPTERVLFYPERDANPFLHLMEPLWMIAGRNDVDFVSKYSRQISSYSTDGVTFNGAYGYRARNHFKCGDQFELAVERLRKFPSDRRTVISLWDGHEDLRLDNEEKDHPCNTAIYLYIRDGKLDMTVTNRSNDMLWGAYGANAVHFSYIQEYLAARIGVGVGTYYQMSNNLHIYTEFGPYSKLVLPRQPKVHGRKASRVVIKYNPHQDPYNFKGFTCQQLVQVPDRFDAELDEWFDAPHRIYQNTFLTATATPALKSYEYYKEGDLGRARLIAGMIQSKDWRLACMEWMDRRIEGRNNATNNTN